MLMVSLCYVSFMLNVAKLIAVVLNVIMLNVVAPCR
jgi:hypothetical protein